MLGDAAVGLLGGLFIAAIGTMVERVVASIPNAARDFPPCSAGCRSGRKFKREWCRPRFRLKMEGCLLPGPFSDISQARRLRSM